MNKLNDMMHVLMQCNLVQKVQIHKIGLNIEVLTQKPQNLENHMINLKNIDELIITHDRIQKIMTKYINLTSQFHQFNPIRQKPQFGTISNPRIFNNSKTIKLIKLIIKDH